jgi:hypothetical protein
MGWVAKRVNEFDKGKFIASNIQWILSFAVFIKVYHLEKWLYFGIIILIIGTWFCGWVVIRCGLWDAFTRETNKGLKEWFKHE